MIPASALENGFDHLAGRGAGPIAELPGRQRNAAVGKNADANAAVRLFQRLLMGRPSMPVACDGITVNRCPENVFLCKAVSAVRGYLSGPWATFNLLIRGRGAVGMGQATRAG